MPLYLQYRNDMLLIIQVLLIDDLIIAIFEGTCNILFLNNSPYTRQGKRTPYSSYHPLSTANSTSNTSEKSLLRYRNSATTWGEILTGLCITLQVCRVLPILISEEKSVIVQESSNGFYPFFVGCFIVN